MLWKMYVKEVRQFIRRPFNIVFMLAAPVFLILLMGYAMSGIIGTTEAENNTKTAMDNGRIVLYLVEEGADSHYQRKFSEFKDYVETGMNIPFEAADSSEDGCQQVDMQKAAALIKVSEEGFYYYRSPYNEPQISKMIRSAYNILLASEYGQSHSYISTREVRQKQINSYTYFTFAELGLIMLYLSLITGQSVFREKDTGTFERICISKASSGKMLLSKIALGCTVGALQIILVYIISGSVLNVEWGSKYILIFVLYMFLALFSSTMGAVAGLLSKKKASLKVM